MRNGSNINLKSSNIKGKKISLIQTCGFDSLFQIFVIALFQSENFKNTVADLSPRNNFFNMILKTSIQGLTKNTYYSRAIILSEIFEAKETFDKCFLSNCEVSIGYLCKKIFNDISSFKEITSCNVCNNAREKSFATIQVKIEDLMHSEFPNSIANSFILKPKHCHNRNAEVENAKCTGTQITKISEVGK